MILFKQFIFSSAHKLSNYTEKDERLHGHTYTLIIGIEGPINSNGIVYDLEEVKNIVNEQVLNILDHNYLNDIIQQPTIENVCKWIWEKLNLHIPLYEIRLQETPTVFAIYRG